MSEVASFSETRYTVSNMKKMQNKDYYSLQEVAEILGISVRSLYRYIDSGRLRAIKVGYWRVNKDDLDKFIGKFANTRVQK